MTHQKNLLIGSLVTILSALLYSMYSAWVKVIGEKGYSFSEIVFAVFFIGWLCLIPYTLKKGLKKVKTDRVRMHILRALFGLGFMYAFVVSLKFTELVDGVMLNNTAPLFMPFIAHYWLGCKLNKKIYTALILGLVGIAFILKPGGGVFEWGSLLALFSGVLMAFSWSSVRKLSIKEPVYRIIFYYFFFSAIITFIPLMLAHSTFEFTHLFGLLLAALLFLGTTALLTYASTLISIVVVSILYYMVIVFSGFWNWLIWNQIPDMWTFFGIILVIAGGVYSILLEKRGLKEVEKACKIDKKD